MDKPNKIISHKTVKFQIQIFFSIFLQESFLFEKQIIKASDKPDKNKSLRRDRLLLQYLCHSWDKAD